MGVFQTSLLLCLLSGSLHLHEAAGDAWGVNYEQLLVTATEEAEVELPCRFWFPSGEGNVARVRWTRDGTAATADNIVYSSTSTGVAVTYSLRTSLSRDLSSGSCVLKIKNVAVSDATTYYFRFELETQGYTGTPGVQLRVKCGAGLTAAFASYGHSLGVREGDRALLPCAFCFSWSRRDHSLQGYWLINNAFDETRAENIVYSSVRNTSHIAEYRGRVALVGSLSSGSCSLEIRDAMKRDSMTYFFRAKVDDGTQFSEKSGITITVFNRSFTPDIEGSKRLIEKVGTRATLNCRTTNSQQADNFKWWKYRSDGQYESLFERSSLLTLEAVAVTDVGWYGCEVTSPNTNSKYSWTALQVFSFPPAQSELRATVPATLGCSVDAVVLMDSVTVRWLLVDAVKWTNSSGQTKFNTWTNSTSPSQSPADGTFTATSWLSFTPSAEDHGRRCRCEASGGDLASTMVQEFILHVKYAPVNTTASVHSAPRLPSVESGDDVTLKCLAHGNPSPTSFNWTREPPNRRQLLHNHTDGAWLLKNVTAEDSGRYVCVASNSEGPGTPAHLDLDVLYAPVLVNVSQDETCGGGGDLCLLCEVKANPRATITWRHVGSDASEWTQTQDGDGTKTRSSVVMKRSQEQNVTCVASNKIDNTEAVFHIKGPVSASWPVHVATGVAVALLLLLLLSALCWRGGVLAAVMKRNEPEPAALFQLGDHTGPDGGAMEAHDRVAQPRADGSAGDGALSMAVSQLPLYCNLRRELDPGPCSQPHPRVHLPGDSAGPSVPNANADCLYSFVGMAAQAEEPQPGALYSEVNRKRATPGPTSGEATVYSTVRPTGAGGHHGSSASLSGATAGEAGGSGIAGGVGDADEQTEALVYASLDFGATSGLP
ncbi:myelin-associated glycoprotein-like [Petromyzon marinus]|uniref:myelin-associated glycoprotein-like n=1 Tax=Petromyzon marinus TaxID=7757 RepID=UPI003F71071D